MARKKAPAKRKAPAKKKAAAKRPAAKTGTTAKATAVKAKMSKTRIISDIAETTDLSRGQVTSVLDALEVLIERHIKKRSVGEFTLPGLLKIRSVKRPVANKTSLKIGISV